MRATTTPTVREVKDLGESIGKIAAFAAMSLHKSFPHLDLEDLVETFTRDEAVGFIGRRFLAAVEESETLGEAAGKAGAALIHAWADARLEARAQLDREAGASPWGPMVLCWCGTEVRDDAEARQGHHDSWHSDQRPATWSTA
ncbi:hypothetical protein M2168_002192 [Streptomyces sp. CZ24]|nr:hypothetical protein [Streptomyces sp. CZ24]MDH6189160.1 hypothetical protein [Streptomyces sp. CZ24]